MYLEDLSREDVISLGYKYLNGDEENGFFIDYDKAKFCFDFVNWNEDTMEKINPDCDLLIADYYLNGNSITINCIKDMIVDLTFRFGTTVISRTSSICSIPLLQTTPPGIAENWKDNSPRQWYSYATLGKKYFQGNFNGANHAVYGMYFDCYSL